MSKSNNETPAHRRGVLSRSGVPSVSATCFTEIAVRCATQSQCCDTLESQMKACGCLHTGDGAKTLQQLRVCCDTIQACCDSGAASLGAMQLTA